jgi:hypothetical protein
MKVSPFDPEATAPGADGPAGQRGDADPRAEMGASPDVKEDEQRPEEMTDEPGYGHGV